MTKEEAQKKLDEAISKGLGFCPAIRAVCYQACVCYQKGIIFNVDKDKYGIKTPWCTHQMLNIKPRTFL
jgi:hypothetical protein